LIKLGLVGLKLFSRPAANIFKRHLMSNSDTQMQRSMLRAFGIKCFAFENWLQHEVYHDRPIEFDLAGTKPIDSHKAY